MNIPKLIKDKRLELKETQRQFGRRFSVTHAAVSDWESGKSEAPYQVIEIILENLTFPQKKICPTCDGKGIISE